MKEYLLELWGGFFTVKNIKIHGYKPGYYFFDSMEKLKEFHNKLDEVDNFKFLEHSIYDNNYIRYETHAVMKLKYNDKIYDLDYNFGYGYEKRDAQYMFLEGNYSCDCNKSFFLSKIYPEFPELNCGNKIKMVEFKIEYLNYINKNFIERKND